MRLGVAGIEPQGGAVDGAFLAPQRQVHVAALDIQVRAAGHGLQRGEVDARLAALVGEEGAQVDVAWDEVAPDIQGGAEEFPGLLRLAEGAHGDTEVVQRVRVVRLEAQGGLIFLHGFLPQSRRGQRGAEVAARAGVPWALVHGVLPQGHQVAVIPLALRGEPAEQERQPGGEKSRVPACDSRRRARPARPPPRRTRRRPGARERPAARTCGARPPAGRGWARGWTMAPAARSRPVPRIPSAGGARRGTNPGRPAPPAPRPAARPGAR